MEIFGIGLAELLVIGVVALIILGPERLPEAARTIGKGIAEVRRAVEPARTAWSELSRDINTGLNPAASGNPWEVHPILQKMTPEEREVYLAGGEMPAAVAAELDVLEVEWRQGNGSSPGGEVAELDYPIPHTELRYEPAGPTEKLDYPPPKTQEEAE